MNSRNSWSFLCCAFLYSICCTPRFHLVGLIFFSFDRNLQLTEQFQYFYVFTVNFAPFLYFFPSFYNSLRSQRKSHQLIYEFDGKTKEILSKQNPYKKNYRQNRLNSKQRRSLLCEIPLKTFSQLFFKKSKLQSYVYSSGYFKSIWAVKWQIKIERI